MDLSEIQADSLIKFHLDGSPKEIECELQSRKLLTTEEIARASGLPISYVVSLSAMKGWDEVPVAHLKAFSRACGINFGDARNMARHLHFCRRRGLGKWRYLRQSPDYETLDKPHDLRLHRDYETPPLPANSKRPLMGLSIRGRFELAGRFMGSPSVFGGDRMPVNGASIRL